MIIGACIDNLEYVSSSIHNGFTSSVVIDRRGRRYVLIEDGSPQKLKVPEDIMDELEVVRRVSLGEFEFLEPFRVVC
jgi:hypothetical protein